MAKDPDFYEAVAYDWEIIPMFIDKAEFGSTSFFPDMDGIVKQAHDEQVRRRNAENFADRIARGN